MRAVKRQCSSPCGLCRRHLVRCALQGLGCRGLEPWARLHVADCRLPARPEPWGSAHCSVPPASPAGWRPRQCRLAGSRLASALPRACPSTQGLRAPGAQRRPSATGQVAQGRPQGALVQCRAPATVRFSAANAASERALRLWNRRLRRLSNLRHQLVEWRGRPVRGRAGRAGGWQSS